MSQVTKPLEFHDFKIRFTDQEVRGLELERQVSKKNMDELRRLMGKKIMPIILQVYHNIPAADLERELSGVQVTFVDLQDGKYEHWGRVIEIHYSFNSREGMYRHVFHFVPEKDGGLNGRILYVQKSAFNRR